MGEAGDTQDILENSRTISFETVARACPKCTGTPEIDFDLVTGLYYNDRASHMESLAICMCPDTAARLAEDEGNFQHRSKTRMFTADETKS